MSDKETAEREDWFQTFLDHTTEKQVLMGYILQELGRPKSALTARRLRKDQGQVSLLGGGTGKSELEILAGLQAFGSNTFDIHYEDPNVSMHGEFNRELERHVGKGLKIGNVTYSNTGLDNPGYEIPISDLIFALHLFHYVAGWQDPENPDNPLKKIHGSLSSDGMALIVHQSSKSQMYDLRKRFREMNGGSFDRPLRGEDLSEALDELKVEHDYKHLETMIYIDSFFQNGTFKPNATGMKMLSFMLNIDFHEIAPELQLEIGKYLLMKSTSVGKSRALRAKDSLITIKGSNYLG